MKALKMILATLVAVSLFSVASAQSPTEIKIVGSTANVLWRGNTFPTSLQLSGNALVITKQLASQLLKTDAGVSGILISSIKVHRNYDGGPILSGGTPPPQP